MKQPMNLQVVLVIHVIDDEIMENVDVNVMNDPLVEVLWNFERDKIKEFNEVVASLTGLGSYTKNVVKLDLDLKNYESPSAKTSILETHQLELKSLPPDLQYVFLGNDDTLPIIVAINI